MTLCKQCTSSNVIAQTPLFAEMKDGQAVVFRWYRCLDCNKQFKLEDDDATREYEKQTGR